MRAPLAAALAAALLVPAAARAQPVSAVSGPDTYLELHLGAFLPRAAALDALDTGYAFGGTFGARFTQNLSVEGGVGFYRATGVVSGSNARLADVPFTASVRLRAPLKIAEASVFGGVGLHVATLSPGVAGASTSSDTSVAFGYHAGAGLGFNLSPTMLVGTEALWTFVEPRFEGVKTRIDGLRVALTLGYHF